MKFKTNIMCGSCIAKVTPVLNEMIGENNWKVDILSPKRILSVTNNNLAEGDIIKAVERGGYKAERLDVA